MVAEIEVFAHVDDVKLVIFVPPPQSVQDFHFHQSLVVKSVNGEKRGIKLWVLIKSFKYLVMHELSQKKIPYMLSYIMKINL